MIHLTAVKHRLLHLHHLSLFFVVSLGFVRLGNTTSLQMLDINMALFGPPTPRNLKSLQSERKLLEKISLNIYPRKTICVPVICKAKVAKFVHIVHLSARKPNLKETNPENALSYMSEMFMIASDAIDARRIPL